MVTKHMYWCSGCSGTPITGQVPPKQERCPSPGREGSGNSGKSDLFLLAITTPASLGGEKVVFKKKKKKRGKV